jgi:hypothetical protein
MQAHRVFITPDRLIVKPLHVFAILSGRAEFMTIQKCWSRFTWAPLVKAAGFEMTQGCVQVCTHGFVYCADTAEGLVQVKSVKYGMQ